jgi:hypothetical protein
MGRKDSCYNEGRPPLADAGVVRAVVEWLPPLWLLRRMTCAHGIPGGSEVPGHSLRRPILHVCQPALVCHYLLRNLPSRETFTSFGSYSKFREHVFWRIKSPKQHTFEGFV